MPGYYMENFGCRATQADAAAIEQRLGERGFQPADAAAADLFVVNTCTVTASADSRARQAIRAFHRRNPDARILVTGCYAQRAPEELAGIDGVRWVVGNSHKSRVGEIVATHLPVANAPNFVPLERLSQSDHDAGAEIHVGDIFAHTELLAPPVFGAGQDRTRPSLKVQDGCDNRCSFCIIPSLRGRSRSLPVEAVLREVKQLAEVG